MLMSGLQQTNFLLMQEKLNIFFFHKPSACDSTPLRLPTITFNSIEIKGKSCVEFLGVIIDENITWNKHIELVENKMSKIIGILYRASHYLDKKKPKKHIFLLYSQLYKLMQHSLR